MAKELDKKREKIKSFIEKGEFKTIQDLFDITAPTPVARYLGSNTTHFNNRLKHPEKFKLQEIYAIAEYFHVEEELIIALVHNQYKENKGKRKK